jgi:hypothetical protein
LKEFWMLYTNNIDNTYRDSIVDCLDSRYLE